MPRWLACLTILSAMSLAGCIWTIHRWTMEFEGRTTPGSYFHKLAEMDPSAMRSGAVRYSHIAGALAVLPVIWAACASIIMLKAGYVRRKKILQRLFPRRNPSGFDVLPR